MSNPGGSSDPASDLQGLFASLRSTSTSSSSKNLAATKDGSPTQTLNRQSYPFDHTQPHVPDQRQAASKLPSFTPFNGSQPRGITSNLNTSRSATPAAAGDRSNVDRTASLLNLLKFSTPTASSPTPSQQPLPVSAASTPVNFQASSSTHSVPGRGISASDLVASSMGKHLTPTTREVISAPQSTNHQDFLLKLLSRSTPAQTTDTEQVLPGSPGLADGQGTAHITSQDPLEKSFENPPSSISSGKRSTSSARNDSPIRVFGSSDDREPTPFEPQDLPMGPTAPKKDSMFTYVNPFEQLSASSPRNVKPTSASGEGNKRKIIEPSPKSIQNSSRRKLTPAGSEILQSIESPATTPRTDERTQIEALVGKGAPSRDVETVAEALNEVASQVGKEVETVLAKAEGNESDLQIKQEIIEDEEAALDTLEDKFQEFATEFASEVKAELDKEENKGLLEESLPRPVAEAVKDAIDATARIATADDWESAEGEAEPKVGGDRVVQVYQFPMKPFVSIDIKQKELSKMSLEDTSITNIARLKKEFDQMDRTLATATTDFIVYASPRTGGLKVIRQDDGEAEHVFQDAHDRIFNVSISTAHPSSPSYGVQNIIATGVSGTVYWATVLKPGEVLTGHDVQKNGLIFPPSPSHSDNSSGGQLKTRAKKSSRNPKFFAIGRGKSIQLVFPEHARASRFLSHGSIIDTDKYFKDRSLKISTGKAGKDFIFSEDDTTILTLDKTGRLRFWDIRDLVDEDNGFPSTLAPVETKAPILTFATARSNEKSWPTSVLLVDKPRPYAKGTALRYVIVGMKQNHTLQLWDLCLGKAVQEVNFPHENESDAICSVCYHPASGIVVVGHPTRNSIYLIHLSAPKYNLPPISQAKFVQRLANKDSSLPRPEATAILSGLREYSFSNKGHLRSVELIPSSSEPSRIIDDAEDLVLFELYIMHSKGVTCVAIKKEDLGWSKDSKVIHPVDAEQEGLIVIRDLREPQLGYFSEPSSNNGEPKPVTASSESAAPKTISKTTNRTISTRDTQFQDPSTSAVPSTLSTNPDKVEKKKKKRSGPIAEIISRENPDSGSASQPSTVSETRRIDSQQAPLATSQAASGATKEVTRSNISKGPTRDASEILHSLTDEYSSRPNGNGESNTLGVTSELLNTELKKIEAGVSGEFNKILSRELGALYNRISEDKRVQDAAGTAKQDAILRLVSSTLGDNIENTLSHIIATNIQQVVVPSITDVTSSVLDKKISEVLTQQLHHALPPLLKLALPEAISRGVQNPEVLRMIAEQLTGKLTGRIEKEFNATLHNSIIPAFKKLAVNVAQKSGLETENRVVEHLRRAESQHRDDVAKIDQLTNLVRGLSETVHMMAAAQSDFQQEILKLQQQAAQDRQDSRNRASSPQGHGRPGSGETVLTQKSPEQEELDMIANLMSEGRYEEGTIQVHSTKLLLIKEIIDSL